MDSLSSAILTAFSFFNSLIGSLALLAFMGVLMVLSLILLSRSRKKKAAKAAKAAGVQEPSLGHPASSPEYSEVSDTSESANDVTILSAAPAGAEAPVAAELTAESVADSALEPAAPAGNAATNEELAAPSGFSFFRRKQKATADSTSSHDANSAMTSAAKDGVPPTLHSVEQEMLATRQLYLNGHISKDVYVAETRSLYARARTE